MNSAVAVPPRISHEAYLHMEAISPIKHEYVAGQMYAMTGTSDVHNVIAGNIYMLLRSHLKGTPCQVFMADVKVKLAEADAFYYPDVMVSCETPPHPYYRQTPNLIVEVLSPSTAKHDSGQISMFFSGDGGNADCLVRLQGDHVNFGNCKPEDCSTIR